MTTELWNFSPPPKKKKNKCRSAILAGQPRNSHFKHKIKRLQILQEIVYEKCYVHAASMIYWKTQRKHVKSDNCDLNRGWIKHQTPLILRVALGRGSGSKLSCLQPYLKRTPLWAFFRTSVKFFWPVLI